MDLASLIYGGGSNANGNNGSSSREEPFSPSGNEKNSNQQQPADEEAVASSSLVGGVVGQPNSRNKRERPAAAAAAAADDNSNKKKKNESTTKQSNSSNKRARRPSKSKKDSNNAGALPEAENNNDPSSLSLFQHDAFVAALPPLDLLYNRNGSNRDSSVLPDGVVSSSNSDVMPNSNDNDNNNHPNRTCCSFVCYPAAEPKAAPTVLTESRRRSVDHQSVRDRWRRRLLDLRPEHDVGHAVATQLRQSRRMLLQQRRREQQQRQQQQQRKKRQRRQRSKDAEAFDKSDSDSEDELLEDGEARLLSQLTQHRHDAAAASDENTVDPQQQQQAKQQTTDYWEYGLTAPAVVEPVVYDPLAYPKSAQQKQQEEEQQSQQPSTRFQQLKQEHYGTTTTTAAADQTDEDALYRVRHIRLPIRHARVTTELPTHNDPIPHSASTLQRRQIFRAAARYLVATNNNHGTSDRWIRLLWKLQHRRPFGAPPLNDSTHAKNSNGIPSREARTQQYRYWSQTLLLSQDQCRRAGTALRDFLVHSGQFRGSNRIRAAERLGLLLSKTAGAAAGPDHLVGASMEVRDRQKERTLWQTCLKEYGSSSSNGDAVTEWKPPLAAAETPPLLESDDTNQEATATAAPPAPSDKRLYTTTPTTGTPLLELTTHYLHLPGTVPPTPSFPLDVVPIIFGPSDRHEQVLHAGFIDEGVAKLTQSSLFVRMCEQQRQQQQPNDNNTAAAAAALQTQLRAVLEQRVRLNQHKLYLRCQRQLQMKAVELPLQFHYRAVADYCSYVINSSVGTAWPLLSTPTTTSGQEDKEENREDEDDCHNSVLESGTTTTTGPTLKAAADHLFDFLDQHLEHNGLQMFGDLHVTFGLLRLAHGLPARSVALLSRPLVEEYDDITAATAAATTSAPRTPFDLVRDVLEDLEDRGLLADHLPGLKSMAYSNDLDRDDQEALYAGELEYALHRSATIFARCVQREPTNAVYHAWHLAAVAGSLLLCSGHRIGGGAAHPYPSGRKDGHDGASSSHLLLGDDPDEDDSNFESEVAPHEVRRALPKLNDLRRETVQAFRRLAHLAQHQRGNRAHRTVMAFLEWRQVVALMLGPPSCSGRKELDRECYQKVRELHYYHQTEWAFQERTEPVLDAVLLRPSDERRRNMAAAGQNASENHNRRLEGLACALEGDPSNIHHWRALAEALGPVGRRVPIVDRLACHGRSCQECARTVGVLNVEHHLRDRPGIPWWGRGRCDWWYTCLLQPSPASSQEVSKIAPATEQRVNDIVSAIQEALSDVEPIVLKSTSNEGVQERGQREPPSLDWLDQIMAYELEERDDGVDQLPPVEARSCSVDRYLPRSILEQSRLASFSSEDTILPLELTADDPGHTFELMAYKVLVLCHMYGVCHKNVDRMVHAMVLASGSETDTQKGCNALCCLQWLHRLGLEVATVYRQVQPTTVPVSEEAAAKAKKKRKNKPASKKKAAFNVTIKVAGENDRGANKRNDDTTFA